jgi:WD40 repeat protein
LPGGQTVLGRTADGRWSAIDLLTLNEEKLPPLEISRDGTPRVHPESRRHRHSDVDASSLGFPGRLSRPAWSPDRKLFAVSSENGIAGLFDGRTLAPLATLRGNMSSVFNLAFSKDSQRLALSSGGGDAVEIWDVETRQALITLNSPDTLLYNIEFTP